MGGKWPVDPPWPAGLNVDALHRILQHLARFETDCCGCLDLQRFAGRRVAPHSSGAILLAKSAEADDRDGFVFLDAVGDAVHDRINRACCGGFGFPEIGCDRLDKIALIHSSFLLWLGVKIGHDSTDQRKAVNNAMPGSVAFGRHSGDTGAGSRIMMIQRGDPCEQR